MAIYLCLKRLIDGNCLPTSMIHFHTSKSIINHKILAALISLQTQYFEPTLLIMLSTGQRSFRVARNVNLRAFSSKDTASAPKDTRMPTPLSLGYDMKYHAAPGNHGLGARPIVVIAGWMGAKERQMKPYLNFYHERNIDTISFAVGPNHVLFPHKAMQQMEAVLNCVADAHKQQEDSGPRKSIGQPSSILFHHFSVGGFLYGQAIIAMQKHSHLNDFPITIKAQIFDSPPDYQNIPKGISRSMGIGGVVEKAIEKCAQGYLKLTYDSAGVMHRASSHAFHENSIPAPALWFYSKADPVCDWQDCVTVTDKWKAKGTEVEECVWEHTPHIQHGRVDPDRYFGTLDTFLKKHKIIA